MFSYGRVPDGFGDYLDGCGRAGSAHVYASIQHHQDFIKQYIPAGTPEPVTVKPTETLTEKPTTKPITTTAKPTTTSTTTKPITTTTPTTTNMPTTTTKPTTTTVAPTESPTTKAEMAVTTTENLIETTTASSVLEFKPTQSHRIDDSLTYCSEGDNGFGSGRIIGGTYASRNSWPSIVAIRVLEGSGSAHQCGGTIIANHWVVTAAHCQGLKFIVYLVY